MKIPFCDLHLQHESLKREIDDAIGRVIERSSFILGPEVDAFEQRFAGYLGVRHAIGTSSGATALLVALQALGVRPGDEVIVPAMTFYATAEAAALLGAIPVFVDVDPKTANIDTTKIREKISAKTKVILPVHLYGQPAELREIAAIATEHNIKVLGDCAHAHGAVYRGVKVGAVEDVAAFSFYPSKNLGCLGEAGMITTNDDELAVRCRKYRDHGSIKKFEHTCVGTNARMAGLQAAVLSVKLPHLDEWNTQRRKAAEFYSRGLADLPVRLPSEIQDIEHVYHVYQMRVAHRERVQAFLAQKGIATTIHYPVAMHRHEGFSYLSYRAGEFPEAEAIAAETLSLPCYPGITEEQLSYVVDACVEIIGQSAA